MRSQMSRYLEIRDENPHYGLRRRRCTANLRVFSSVEFSCRPAGGQRLRGFNQAGLRRENRVEGCVVNVISFNLSVVSPRIAIVKTTKCRRVPAHDARRAPSASIGGCLCHRCYDSPCRIIARRCRHSIKIRDQFLPFPQRRTAISNEAEGSRAGSRHRAGRCSIGFAVAFGSRSVSGQPLPVRVRLPVYCNDGMVFRVARGRRDDAALLSAGEFIFRRSPRHFSA